MDPLFFDLMLVVRPPILTPVLVRERSKPIIFATFVDYYIYVKNIIFGENKVEVLNKKIFVAIPSFQEEDLLNTVDSIFLNASNPSRITVGICNQRVVDGEFESFECYGDYVKVINVRSPIPMGLGFAYSSICHLVEDEEYFMRIDAGTRMKPDWDKVLIESYESVCRHTGNKTIISGQIGAFYKTDEQISTDFYTDDLWTFKEGCWFQDFVPHRSEYWIDGLIKQFVDVVWDVSQNKYNSNKEIIDKFIWNDHDKNLGFKQICFVNGAFHFSKSQLIRDCPPDPRIVFWGEEHLLGLRAVTRGYEIYELNISVLFTLSKPKSYIEGQGFLNWRNFGKKVFAQDQNILSKKILEGKEHGLFGAPNEQLHQQYFGQIGLKNEDKEKWIKNDQ